MIRGILGLILTVLSVSSAVAKEHSYTEGQVWAYKTRPGDTGSLLKIQKIERDPSGVPIYHISVIGFHFANPKIFPILPHAPVSQRTLDESVTILKADPGTFPSADEGIAEWRRAKGGVFTVTVAQILDVMDSTLPKETP